MAKVYGKHSKYAEEHLKEYNDKISLTIILFLAFCFLGIGFAIGSRSLQGFLVLLLLAAVFFFNRRILDNYFDKKVLDRAPWLKGFDGELIVTEILSELEGNYHIFNSIKGKYGDIDHLVIGPCGLVVIETKNNYGLISASWDSACNKETLLLNNRVPSKNPVNQVLAQGVNFKDDLKRQTGDLVSFEALLVYPFGHIKASKIGKASVVNKETLKSYVEKLDLKFTNRQIRKYVNAVKQMSLVNNLNSQVITMRSGALKPAAGVARR